jgi:hypothetical protein
MADPEQLVGEPLTVKFWEARQQGKIHAINTSSQAQKK